MNFHLKILIGLLAFFGIVILGMYLYEPFMLKWYEWELNSDDPADKVAAVDGFIGMGEVGKTRFKEVFADGPEAAELLIECWADDNMVVEDPKKVFAIIKGKGTRWRHVSTNSLAYPTYLHLASSKNYCESAVILICKGCSLEKYCRYMAWKVIEKPNRSKVRSVDLLSGTPLHIAIAWDHDEVISVLVSSGADVNKIDADNNTPLFLVALYDNVKVADLLISKGAKVNSNIGNASNPLFAAVFWGNVNVVKFLISKGANVNNLITVDEIISINNSDEYHLKGKTTLDTAKERNHTEIAEILRKYGAKTGAELKAEAEKNGEE